jgi:hypothetical protein
MILDKLQHALFDDAVQLRALARCARVRRERVDEVGETVEHEHGAVPRLRGGRGGSNVPAPRRVLLRRRHDAHLDGGVDERVERALNRCAVLAGAATVVVVIVVVDFCGVQRDDRAQVLRVRQERLRGRERGVG